METGLSGSMPSAGCHREERRISSSSAHASLPSRSFSPDLFDERKPGAITQRAAVVCQVAPLQRLKSSAPII
jgi:hypothetical protein